MSRIGDRSPLEGTLHLSRHQSPHRKILTGVYRVPGICCVQCPGHRLGFCVRRFLCFAQVNKKFKS